MSSRNPNLSLALSLAAVVLGMLMMAYASVPLYRVFCRATGFGGTAWKAEAITSRPATSRVMTVRFDANVNGTLPWSFKPLQVDTQVTVGQQKHIEDIARNEGGKTLTGTATFNISPVKAGIYFNKIQCFCFTRQTLKPGEEKRLGVTFFIDPAINDDHELDDVRTITLSYTFFSVQK